MAERRISNVIGIDDAPFDRAHRGDVRVVGAVLARTRLDGVVIDRVRRDGANSTARITSMVRGSPFHHHAQAIALNGIALAGFNVVDLELLSASLDRPVIAIARRKPDLAAIERALKTRVPGGDRKWRLIVKAGPMEPIEGVFVQRAGLSLAEVRRFLIDTRIHGSLPEAIRVAHLIAGAIGSGVSRGRA
jgi:uncharacterized protein